MTTSDRPRVAIIDGNTLAALGLQQILQTVMPFMTVDVYGTVTELSANHADSYFHYFVSRDILLADRPFFEQRQRKTIILVTHGDCPPFHTINITLPERQLILQLLQLEQHAHHGGRNLPVTQQPSPLSAREIEVMTLIVQGLINKEIADRLNISLSTVITHRKNIMDKLAIKSVSALTIYAVMHGYVDVNSI
jgi:DNA-binding NarL/FixJ family response regulator